MALHRQRQYTKDGVSLQRRRNSDGSWMSEMITRRILTKHFHIAHQTVFLHSDHFLMNFFSLFTPVNPFLHSFDVFMTISDITASLCYSVILSDVTESDFQLDYLAQTLIWMEINPNYHQNRSMVQRQSGRLLIKLFWNHNFRNFHARFRSCHVTLLRVSFHLIYWMSFYFPNFHARFRSCHVTLLCVSLHLIYWMSFYLFFRLWSEILRYFTKKTSYSTFLHSST